MTPPLPPHLPDTVSRRVTPQSFDDTTWTYATLPPIETPQDLFSVALAMEREAVMRYAELADRMELCGDMALAALFRGLQTEESGHEYGITAWIERENLTRRDTVRFSWDMAEDGGAEGSDSLSTPWKALATALINEERTFAFYANTAHTTEDRDVQRYAEGMAREELSHIALLRMQRRAALRADHAERAELSGRPQRPEPPRVDTSDDLAALACACEAAAATTLAEASRELREDMAEDTASIDLFDALSAEASGRADGLGTLGDDMIAPAANDDGANHDTPARRLLRREARRAAETFDTFMHIAEAAADEDLRREAQGQADTALARLARLRDRLAALAEAP